MNERWLQEFRAETEPIIRDPFLLCLAEAIAAVESGWGERTITGPEGINEIGYKALWGYPSTVKPTREAGPGGALVGLEAAFRLFRSRNEQARSLLYLMQSSTYYEAARLMFMLVFYSAYAPGRTSGAVALVHVFNQIAASWEHPGVRPFSILASGGAERGTLEINHRAAGEGVKLFAALTARPKDPAQPGKEA